MIKYVLLAYRRPRAVRVRPSEDDLVPGGSHVRRLQKCGIFCALYLQILHTVIGYFLTPSICKSCIKLLDVSGPQFFAEVLYGSPLKPWDGTNVKQYRSLDPRRVTKLKMLLRRRKSSSSSFSFPAAASVFVGMLFSSAAGGHPSIDGYLIFLWS